VLDSFSDPIAVSDKLFQVENAPPEGGGGGGMGKPIFQPLEIELPHGGPASARLFEIVSTGAHVRSATLTTPDVVYELDDVLVISAKEQANGAAGSIPTERIKLAAATLGPERAKRQHDGPVSRLASGAGERMGAIGANPCKTAVRDSPRDSAVFVVPASRSACWISLREAAAACARAGRTSAGLATRLLLRPLLSASSMIGVSTCGLRERG
jgi:hypothetical protein